MNHVRFQNVELTGGFWKEMEDKNRNTTIWAVRDQFKNSGRFDAFRFDWKEGMEKQPHFFWESDIAKWIEGAANILEKHEDEELLQEIESVIDLIEKNQEESGYFNIYFTVCEKDARFQRRTDHELYCLGHLIEAAVAYYDATGKDRFLKLMEKYLAYVEQVFIKEDSAAFVTPGHEELELALVRLYRCTGNKKYLDMACFFVDKRGNNAKDGALLYDYVNVMYDQSHMPVREQKTAVGHSVRACYLYCAMADLALELGDEALKNACKALFQDIINKKMYITGGIGQTYIGEAFTMEYDLPNKRAYAETCAAISLMFFAQRMLLLEKNSTYADIVEKVIYNGMLAGLSLDGKAFFYENPLEVNPLDKIKDTAVKEESGERFPINQRVEVFWCSCCPPNLNRVLSSMGGLIYSLDEDTLYVHQYMDSTMEQEGVRAKMTTAYPADGKVAVLAEGVSKIAVRIPAWCKEFTLNKTYECKNGYAYIANDGGEIVLEMAMTPYLVRSNPKVFDNGGKAALIRGPVVYCMESVDNGEDIADIAISLDLNSVEGIEETMGVLLIEVDGYRHPKSEALYLPLVNDYEKTRVKMIPYYAFANRGEAEMKIWTHVMYQGE